MARANGARGALAALARLVAIAAALGQTPDAAMARARVPTDARVRIDGGRYRPLYRQPVRGANRDTLLRKVVAVEVRPFELHRDLVTNAEYLEFVRGHPEWRRSRVSRLFADESYLHHWRGDLDPGPGGSLRSPVVYVSWFAARAYCAAGGARLPTWDEWEFAAAADATRADARSDPQWRQRMLDWYASHGEQDMRVGQRAPDLYGVHDLPDGVWEWVDDFNALLVSGDDREQGDPDRMKFCGAGALSLRDREAYAVLMRVAMLSSLEARFTTRDLGFRCAK